jgi:hypothetical protein
LDGKKVTLLFLIFSHQILQISRSHSSHSLHVQRYDPNQPLPTQSIASWYFQEYNPLIQSAGEIRVICGGPNHILSRLYTDPNPGGQLYYEELKSPIPLEILQKEKEYIHFVCS